MNFKSFSFLAFLSFVAAQSDPTTLSTATSSIAITTASSLSSSTATLSGSSSSSSAPPASTASVGIPPCINACLNQAGQAANCDPLSNDCLCSDAFMTAAQNCASSCSPAEQQSALGLAQQACGGAVSASGSSAAVSSTLASVTASETPNSSPTSSPNSNPDDSVTTPSANGAATSLVIPTSTLTRLFSTPTISVTGGTATGTPASTASTAGALTNAASQSLWTLAAGVLGVSIAL
ncbi:hypothetical protein Ac2012v2_005328 [Leucoagaricus gongylophorus]